MQGKNTEPHDMHAIITEMYYLEIEDYWAIGLHQHAWQQRSAKWSGLPKIQFHWILQAKIQKLSYW